MTKPWEGKHWKELVIELRDDIHYNSHVFYGFRLALQALEKDWEEQQLKFCKECNQHFKPHLLDAIRCPKCGGDYEPI